jgi:hypothetical protein
VFFYIFSLSVIEAHRKPTTGTDFKKIYILLISLYSISMLIVCPLIPKFIYDVLPIGIC